MDEHSDHSGPSDNNLLIVIDALRLYGPQGVEALTHLEDTERSYLQNLALTLKGETESYPIRERLEEHFHRYHELCLRNQTILEAMENETKRTARDKFGKLRDVKYKKAFRRSKKLCDRPVSVRNMDENIRSTKEDVLSQSGTSTNLTTSMEDYPLLRDAS